MRKFAIRLMLAVAAGSAAAPLHAGWNEFWNGVHSGAEINNQWPHPYVEADRVAAVAPFHAMVAKGWERQNLIGENYFDEGSSKLNQAGVIRIRTILSQGPVEHRTLFVQRDLLDDVTKARLDLVQRAAVSLQPRGTLPEVVLSDLAPDGRSAEQVTAENKAFTSSIPTPRLSKGAPGGASGGSSGG